uniref:Membrane insertase YidC/Oxa/ALB C-terminal domain-containing protein n=1 Tax=Photinus pyralis TaxID=7054 RepID=A0A1Y1LNP5_PHOPY
MFRKSLIGHYKLYYKHLQSLKNRVVADRNAEFGHTKYLDELKLQATSIVNRLNVVIASNTCTSPSEQQSCNKQNKYLKLKLSKSKFLKCFSQKNNAFIFGTAGLTLVSDDAKPAQYVIEPIPEPPPVLESDALAEAASQLTALGEPTLESLGLGGWSPVGIILNCLEFLHVSMNLPWWGAIVVGTVIARLLMFPLVIITQRNAARMNNHLPQMQAIQVKMTEARQSGNQIESARYAQELMLFMKEKNLNPLKNMIVPMAQMPIFVSFFVGLRRMANLPVDSLRDGGIYWFTDLTVPDQFYALPIITSLTLWTTIELGTDAGRLSSQNLQTMKYVLRALPIIIFPFTINFPGVILCYWVASNFISLAQVGFLRIPTVRSYFKIEALVKHNPQNLPMKSKGFTEGLKESWTNAKITRQLEDRRQFDELQFKRAGRGPIEKTYKYDPTKQTNPNAVSAKKR